MPTAVFADAGREQFRVQEALMRELSALPDVRVRRIDVLAGRVGARLARVRRRLAERLAARSAPRGARA